jgi:hypothetical protein
LTARFILKINIRKLLAGMVADDKTCGLFLNSPWRREAAGGHGLKDQIFDLHQQENGDGFP